MIRSTRPTVSIAAPMDMSILAKRVDFIAWELKRGRRGEEFMHCDVLAVSFRQHGSCERQVE
jgi:hypothetical protein